jgi:hypothetical protein
VVNLPARPMTSPARFSSTVCPKAAPFCVSDGVGVDGSARVKALC